MAASREFLEHILEQLEPLGGITARGMFGGFGIYKDGTITAIVADDTLYFKVTNANRPDYEAAESQPFSYAKQDGKTMVMSYWEVPPTIMEEPELLQEWFMNAHRAVVAA